MIRLQFLAVILWAAVSFHASAAQAQALKPAPDLLIFVNGEQLTGTVERADAKTVTFKSFMAGEITVPWANVKQLNSAQTFALLKPNVKLTRKNALTAAPEGALSAEAKAKTVDLTLRSPTTSTTVPLAEVDRLIPTADFTKALQPVNWSQGWAGTATGGVSLVRATENSTTFNGAIALTRALPRVDWLPARSRTSLNYNQSYGTTSQTGTPTVKTNIFHANAEQDEYFSARFFVLFSTTFDHNFSQNLDLQQEYGAGIGLNLIKNLRQTLDLKADLQYEKQLFFGPVSTVNIIGSTLSETYLRNLPKKIVFNEFGSVTPAFNDPSAFSSHVNAGFNFPVYKGFAFTLGGVDDYLNNAPVGSKKNSAQFTTGVTYTIKPR